MKRVYHFLFLLISLFATRSFAQTPVLLQEADTSINIEYAKPKEYIIGKIEVSGTEQLDKNVIMMLSGIAPGDKVTVPGDKFSKAIENLWKQNLFGDIKINAKSLQGNLLNLEIVVIEKPRLSKFSFQGLKKGDVDDVKEKIKLVRGKVVTDYLVKDVKSKVIQFYTDKAFRNVKVDVRTEPDPGGKNTVTMYIKVDKGDKVKVKDINFSGNTTISNATLWRSLKETKRKRWWGIFRSSKYLEDNYEKDKLKLIEKYNEKGYRDAHIVQDCVYVSDKNRVSINIKIDEGHKYYFRNISWVGNTKYTSKVLSAVLGIKKGDVYNQAHLEQKLLMNPNGGDVSSLYMDDGYLFFQVQPVETLVENDSIDLEMRMSEGKQATINKVTVSGNTKTNDHVVMREIRTKPGQLFRRSDIIRTQRELAQLGYFNPEKMNVIPTPNPANGTVDIEYVVEEKPSDQIELSGGWGAGRIIGTLGVSFTNFSTRNVFKKGAWRPLPSGDGQRLSIRAQSTGIYYQAYNMSFTEPWLGGRKPNSLSVSAFHSVQTNGQESTVSVNGFDMPNPARQALYITGGSIGFGKRLKWPDDFFTLYTELNYQYYDIDNFGQIFAFSKGYANNISGKITLSRNSIDNPIFTRSGSNITLTGHFTPPYSYFNNVNYQTASAQERYKFVEYMKYKFTAAWYTPLTNKRGSEGKEARNLVLYTKAGFGFLGYYNSAVGVAPFERFYLGGSGLTGYALDGREIIALRGYDDQSINAFGGSPIVSKYTMELRYPISLNPSATIYVLGFAEAGNAWSTFKDYNPFSVKRSAGLGVRIFLPMFGLLGLDYGWRFDDVNLRPQMPESQFHFTIGVSMGEL